MKINFFLPGFYENFRLITTLADMMGDEPGLFFDNIRIGAAYGCFPGSIWNGGRVILGSATRQEMEYAIEEYNKRGIAVRYTFTNPLLQKVHLPDTYCNQCMELGDNGKNEVIVNSPLLEDFIRKMYPGYALISSTTKCLNDMDAVRGELEKDYRYVVLDSAMNNTQELFQMPHREKLELIANHYCADDCPRRRDHYKAVGKCQLEFSELKFEKCANINREFYQIMENRSFITADDIMGRYYDAGLRNFKLDGRGFNRYKVLESFVYYLVKPEHRDRVRLRLLKKCF
ncbi:MAG: hypothetical protein LUE96_07500 [Lachnospiraceae bacterium]|nr:hypothetical protein [Lachnospiraceae bacterium]